MEQLIDKAIKSRATALKNRIELLDTILFELKKNKPNLNLCLKGIELVKNHSKMELNIPDNLTFVKEIINHAKIKRTN